MPATNGDIINCPGRHSNNINQLCSSMSSSTARRSLSTTLRSCLSTKRCAQCTSPPRPSVWLGVRVRTQPRFAQCQPTAQSANPLPSRKFPALRLAQSTPSPPSPPSPNHSASPRSCRWFSNPNTRLHQHTVSRIRTAVSLLLIPGRMDQAQTRCLDARRPTDRACSGEHLLRVGLVERQRGGGVRLGEAGGATFRGAQGSCLKLSAKSTLLP